MNKDFQSWLERVGKNFNPAISAASLAESAFTFAMAISQNHTANTECLPTEVTFANGIVVKLSQDKTFLVVATVPS